MGSGKDRCNYFAMKGWKNDESNRYNNGPVILPPNARFAMGWVSEVHARRGVLTFNPGNNVDERVSFTASKVYFYEKRLGTRQPLTSLLSLGDQVFFEAVPNLILDAIGIYQ
jgi:hypothetical protein